MTPFYDTDLAYIHHTGFGAFARNSAPGLVRLLRQHGVRGGRLIDLGCGSGIWAAAARRAGFDVLGLDVSAGMIRLARKVAPGCRFRRASLHQAELPRCTAITALGEAFNYLAGTGSHDLRRLFKRVYRCLEPGGLLLFDVILAGHPSLTRRIWQTGPDWAVLVDAREPEGKALLIREITAFRKLASGYRRTAEIHRVRLFRKSDLLRALRLAGFRTCTCPSWGDQTLLPRRLAFVAAKPKTNANT